MFFAKDMLRRRAVLSSSVVAGFGTVSGGSTESGPTEECAGAGSAPTTGVVPVAAAGAVGKRRDHIRTPGSNSSSPFPVIATGRAVERGILYSTRGKQLQQYKCMPPRDKHTCTCRLRCAPSTSTNGQPPGPLDSSQSLPQFMHPRGSEVNAALRGSLLRVHWTAPRPTDVNAA